jgi:hypothetical protein
MAQEQQKTKKRGRTSGMSILLVLLLVIVGAAGAVGTLLVLGDGSLFGGKEAQARAKEKDEDRTGKVAVPISVRAIEPYEALMKEQLINPQTREFAVRWIEEEKAKAAGFILGKDIASYFGRVTKREKLPGYAFTEGDFMPKGTRPGPSSAVEAGMRGLYLDPKDVAGLEGLEEARMGDRFDLLAIQKVDVKSAPTDARFVSPGANRASADQKAWDTSVRYLVKNGKVLLPLPEDLGKRKGKRLFVQVSEAEFQPLNEAIALGAKLSVSLRSGQPGAGDTDLPEPEAPPAMDSIEVIQGGKSSSIQVPATGGGESAEQPK